MGNYAKYKEGGKTVAQTPSPKSDRIYGSSNNSKGSASSEGKSIELSSKTIDTLEKKLKEFRKNHPNSKNITLLDLKKVYRRGSGAYSKSHRPTISGGVPNSRAAWSFARVNKFLEKASGKKVKEAYVQDDDLLKYKEGGVIDEYAQQLIDIVSMNPNLEKYQKYKDILRDKYNIDFDYIYKDQQYIDNATLKDIKSQDDFLDFGNWLIYAKKISKIRGFIPMDLYDVKNDIMNDDVWNKMAIKLDFIVEKVPYIERGTGSGDIARAFGDKITYTEHADLYYFLHELGHIYDGKNKLNGIIKNPAYSPTSYGTMNGGETFAENFAIYFINPSALKDWNKEVYESMDLAINDKFKKELNKLVNYAGINFEDGGEISKRNSMKNKEEFTLVGIYKSNSNEYDKVESEDLSKEGLLGYRSRYNNKDYANMHYGYVTWLPEELEEAKKHVERINKEIDQKKENKKIRDAENKIKRLEKSKEDAIKLDTAKKEIVKKAAYLMEEKEYQEKVVPILKEYESFLKKNSKYLLPIDYDSFIYTTFEEALEKNLQGKNYGHNFNLKGKYDEDISQEIKTIRNWNQKKLKTYKDVDDKPQSTLIEVINKSKEFLEKFSNFFDEDLINKGLNKSITKSNKWNVKQAIEDDTYKKLLDDDSLSEDQLEKISQSVDVKVPKKVFGLGSIREKEIRQQFEKQLIDLPTINKNKLNDLINEIRIDFKPIEEQTFVIEKERFIEQINKFIQSKKVFQDTLEKIIKIWQQIFNYGKPLVEVVKTGRYAYSYRGQGEEIVERNIYYTDLSLKEGWESIVDKYLKEYVQTLKYSFIKAIINNFYKVTKPIKSFEKISIVRGVKGFEGIYRFHFEDGSYFDFKAEAIGAGGYNIQVYHFRYITDFINITLANGTKIKGGLYTINDNFSAKKVTTVSVIESIMQRVLNGEINSDEGAFEVIYSGLEVTNELYDELREAEKKFTKKSIGLQVGDIVKVKGKYGNEDFEANYRGTMPDGKLVVVPKSGMQISISKDEIIDNYEQGGQLQITCKNCGWSWNEKDSSPSDLYICHNCGYDNSK
jgi:hypothetical protein